MNHDEFRAETQKIRDETLATFNAFERVVVKYPRSATWLMIVLLVLALVLTVKACV